MHSKQLTIALRLVPSSRAISLKLIFGSSSLYSSLLL
nr:MAG TPA: hypothetical protein [Caudoviricetes sp.]